MNFVDRKKITREGFIERLQFQISNGVEYISLKDYEVFKDDNSKITLVLDPDLTYEFENVDLSGFWIQELRNVRLILKNCDVYGDFRNWINCEITIRSTIRSEFPLEFRNCEKLQFNFNSGQDSGQFLTLNKYFKGIAGLVFNGCSELEIAISGVTSPFNLQFWQTNIKNNSLSYNAFNVFQMRNTTVEGYLNLGNSSFASVEFGFTSIDYIDVEFDKLFKAAKETKLMGKSLTLRELSRLYSKMGMIKESIMFMIESSNSEINEKNKKLRKEIADFPTKKIENLMKIKVNKMKGIFVNDFLERFYSPQKIIFLTVLIGIFFSFIYLTGSFSSGVHVFRMHNFLTSLYFSFITLFTVGYGDIVPLGAMRVFASCEAGLGIVLAAFVSLTVARRYTI